MGEGRKYTFQELENQLLESRAYWEKRFGEIMKERDHYKRRLEQTEAVSSRYLDGWRHEETAHEKTKRTKTVFQTDEGIRNQLDMLRRDLNQMSDDFATARATLKRARRYFGTKAWEEAIGE